MQKFGRSWVAKIWATAAKKIKSGVISIIQKEWAESGRRMSTVVIRKLG
jgi:hypothetical protein